MSNIQNLIDLYHSEGHQSYGENVSQLQHAVQCARLAEQHNASDALIVATLLHDIGHLLYNQAKDQWDINDRHESQGAFMLADLYDKSVTEPIKLHVLAKRYLCATDTDYYQNMSEASKMSLELQGGALSSDHQLLAFEKNNYFKDAINLRHWDDLGKDAYNKDVDFDYFIPLIKSVASFSH